MIKYKIYERLWVMWHSLGKYYFQPSYHYPLFKKENRFNQPLPPWILEELQQAYHLYRRHKLNLLWDMGIFLKRAWHAFLWLQPLGCKGHWNSMKDRGGIWKYWRRRWQIKLCDRLESMWRTDKNPDY